jgi:DNA-binding beta-propeller fold protein YncE
MNHPTRRSFLKKIAVASGTFVIPRISLAQQNWQVRTIAGTGVAGYEFEGSDGLIATETPINNPYGVVIGPGNDLYFCEVDTGRTRRLNLSNNRLTTIAGNGEKGFVTESRRPRETSFNAPHEIRWDEQGNLYIVERDSHSVRRIAAQSGLVTILAGNGEPGDGGDGGTAVLSQLNRPHSIAFDSIGNLLICDIGNHRLRIVDRGTGIIRTLAGTGERVQTPDTGQLEGTPLLGPRSIDTDPNGNAYLVLREGNAIFQIDIQGNRLQRIAGTGEQGYTGDGGPATSCTFNGPKGIAYSRQDHSLYIVDTENHVIRRMALATGIIDTVLGNGERGNGPDGNPLNCKMDRPHGVCVHEGLVYVTDSESHRVRAISGLM